MLVRFGQRLSFRLKTLVISVHSHLAPVQTYYCLVLRAGMKPRPYRLIVWGRGCLVVFYAAGTPASTSLNLSITWILH